MADGTPAYATAVSVSDVADGWRDRRADGGVLIEIATGEIVASGLSMPHSPRVYRDKVWLLNAGTGEFGQIDPKTGAFDAVAYSPTSLAEYLDSGTPVFIDFTAAWCVTCQFDKMTVLSDKSLADAFEDAGAVFMVADWTVRDPEITEALTGFGASGVPLYVYYSGSGEPEVLPLPLTKKSVLNSLSGARG